MILHGVRHEAGWVLYPDGTRLRAISGGGSSPGKTTVTNQVPAKGPEELALIGKQNEILDIQIVELKRQNDALGAIFPEQQKLLAAQTQAAISTAEFQKLQFQQASDFAPESLAFAREQMEVARKAGVLNEQLITKALADLEGTPEEQQIRTLSNQRALAILKGEAPPLLPGQQERIDKVFGTARAEATEELTRFGEDLATSRGMRVTDSPIGNELLRQKATLERGLAAGKANAELNVGQAEMQFGEAVRQFQENLRQRGFENRLALTGRSSSGGGLPIAGSGAGGGMTPTFAGTTSSSALAGGQNLLNSLAADRMGSGSQSSRGPGADYTGTAIGAGGAVAGAAIIGTAPYWAPALAAAFSSARLKTAILPYDPDEYDRALAKVNATPITTWKYRWEPESQRPHTGPILELSPDDIKLDDTRLDLLSYSGLLHAAVKAVDRKVTRLEGRLPVGVARGLPVPRKAA